MLKLIPEAGGQIAFAVKLDFISIGVLGVLSVEVTAKFALAALSPQSFFAITLIEPSEIPALRVIEFVVVTNPGSLELDHPLGRLQVYVSALAIAGIEYTNPVASWHTADSPVIAPDIIGAGAFTFTGIVSAVLVPQSFLALTVIFPEPELAVVTVIDEVVLVPVHPFGKVQMYSEASGSLVTEYVSEVPGQTMSDPEMAEGVAGVPAFMVIAKVCSALVPQSFKAFTVIFPPEASLVKVIDVVELVPVHPLGFVHS